MLGEERRNFILNKLNQNKRITVKNLSQILDVSRETIRRDLEKLQNKNLLKKIHGGAVPIPEKEELSFNIRKNQNIAEKKEIAEKAAAHIKENDTIFIDISSTSMFLAEKLKDFNNLTIITNSIPVINKLSYNRNITVISTGGILIPDYIAFVGPQANYMVNNYFADKFFVSCKGISPEYGATDSNDLEIEVKMNMVKRASQIIILADYSKFDRRGLSSFANLNDINRIITDSSLNNKTKKVYAEKGIVIE